MEKCTLVGQESALKTMGNQKTAANVPNTGWVQILKLHLLEVGWECVTPTPFEKDIQIDV